jgi:hypothetical protein
MSLTQSRASRLGWVVREPGEALDRIEQLEVRIAAILDWWEGIPNDTRDLLLDDGRDPPCIRRAYAITRPREMPTDKQVEAVARTLAARRQYNPPWELFVDDARAALEAAEAAAWQPIDTAPQDGTPVDLWLSPPERKDQ